MTNVLIEDLRLLLVRDLRAFAREVDLCPDDDVLWRAVPGVTNTVGNLALHVSGNLRHYVGAILGGTGYVRDRPLEFSRRTGTRAEVRAEIEDAIGVVSRVLPALPAEVLERDYPEAGLGVVLPTHLFLLHLATHLAHHLGQAGYLRRALTGDATSSGPISMKELAAG